MGVSYATLMIYLSCIYDVSWTRVLYRGAADSIGAAK